MSLHLTDDQLVDRIYGISDAGTEHLDSCPECQLRWSRMLQRREQSLPSVPVSNQQLRQQRRAILSRLSAQRPALRIALGSCSRCRGADGWFCIHADGGGSVVCSD